MEQAISRRTMVVAATAVALAFLAARADAPPPTATAASAAPTRSTAIAAGGDHTCVVIGGEVLCWGGQQYQLPQRTTPLSEPAPVAGLDQGVTGIAAGGYNSCAIANETLRCWGGNQRGQLGNGNTSGGWEPNPQLVNGIASGVTKVALSGGHACAIDVKGAVWCWGDGQGGELGTGALGVGAIKENPVKVEALTRPAIDIAVGGSYNANPGCSLVGCAHSCVVTDAGLVECWGDNQYGELGAASTSTCEHKISGPPITGSLPCSTTPMSVAGLHGTALSVAAGNQFTCAVTSGGTAECWGNNDRGQLGARTTVVCTVEWTAPCSQSPVAVHGIGAPVSALALGRAHACALTESGAVKCWGDNYIGQLGDGTQIGSSVPRGVLGLQSGVLAIAAGNDHTCALMSSGGVRCWGSNYSGELGDGTFQYRLRPVEVNGLARPPLALQTAVPDVSPPAVALPSTGGFPAGEPWHSQVVTLVVAAFLLAVGVIALRRRQT